MGYFGIPRTINQFDVVLYTSVPKISQFDVQWPRFGVMLFENAGIFVILKTRKYFLSLSYQTFYYTLQIL